MDVDTDGRDEENVGVHRAVPDPDPYEEIDLKEVRVNYICVWVTFALHVVCLCVVFVRLMLGGLGDDDVWTKNCTDDVDIDACLSAFTSDCADPEYNVIGSLPPTIAMGGLQVACILLRALLLVLFPDTPQYHGYHVLLAVVSLMAVVVVAFDVALFHDPVDISCSPPAPNMEVQFRFGWSTANIMLVLVLPVFTAVVSAAPAMLPHTSAANKERSEQNRLERQRKKAMFARRRMTFQQVRQSIETESEQTNMSELNIEAESWLTPDVLAVLALAGSVAAPSAGYVSQLRKLNFWQIPSVMKIIKQRHRPVPVPSTQQRTLVQRIQHERGERATELNEQRREKERTRSRLLLSPTGSFVMPPKERPETPPLVLAPLSEARYLDIKIDKASDLQFGVSATLDTDDAVLFAAGEDDALDMSAQPSQEPPVVRVARPPGELELDEISSAGDSDSMRGRVNKRNKKIPASLKKPAELVKIDLSTSGKKRKRRKRSDSKHSRGSSKQHSRSSSKRSKRSHSQSSAKRRSSRSNTK